MALGAVGLHYGLLIGLATGLMSFIPFVGWALGLITATTIAVVQFWPDAVPILVVVGIFIGAQVLDAGFLSPNIVGSKIGLHPVWLIFSLFVFSYLFGFVGVWSRCRSPRRSACSSASRSRSILASPVYPGDVPIAPPTNSVLPTAAASVPTLPKPVSP